MRKGGAIYYAAGLIALYLVVYNGTKAGRVIASGARGSTEVIKSLQGR